MIPRLSTMKTILRSQPGPEHRGPRRESALHALRVRWSGLTAAASPARREESRARLFRPVLQAAGVALVLILLGTAGIEAGAADAKKATLTALVEGLKSGDKTIRRDASYRLSLLGPEAKAAVPDLVKALDDSEDQVWFNSITALARIGPAAEAAIPDLIKQLDKADRSRNNGQYWYRTAFALGAIGPAALPELIKSLNNDRSHVRSAAAKAIGWIGPAAGEAITPLTGRLGDGDADVRNQAAEALGRIGPDALPAVTEALRHEQAMVRAGAALAILTMGDPAKPAGPALAAALKAEADDAARAHELRALSRLQYPPVELLPLAVPLLRHESEPVRQAAVDAVIAMTPAATTSVPALKPLVASSDVAEAKLGAALLGMIGPEAGGAVPELIAARSRPEAASELASAIDESLILIGPPAVPALVKVMNSAGGDAAHWSVQCLRKLGPAAVPAMIQSLESREVARQRDAIQVLALVGDAAEPAIPELVKLAQTGSREVKGPALVALARAGAKPDVVLPLAQVALDDRIASVRQSGAEALATLGVGARPAVPLLINGLNDKDATVAMHSARALGSLGAGSASAVGPLSVALDRPEPVVQVAAARAIASLGEVASGAVPALVKLLPTAKLPLQPEIAAALGAMGAAARDALPAVEQSLASENAGTRAAALTAFARIETDNGRKVETLKQALDDAAQPVRVAAITELGRLGRAAEPAAEKLYELTEASGEREQALEVLGGMRIRNVPLLVRALENSDPYVRQYAAERLGELGKDAKESVPDLRKLLEDQEDFVKRTARASIREIERAN